MKSIIIIGMHRSGTSLIASLLQQSGLDIGGDLMGSAAGNEKGHFENLDFYFFHRQVLAKLQMNPDGWDDTEIDTVAPEDEEEALRLIAKNQSALWGWKDPRTTLFLKFWAKLLPEACFLFVYRSPAAVIDSLYRRATDDLFVEHPEKCADAWLHYNKLILNYHKEFEERSLLIDVQSFIHAYPDCIAQINKKFGTDLNTSIPTIFDQKLFQQHSERIQSQSKLLYAIRPEILSVYQDLIHASWHPYTRHGDPELLPLSANAAVRNNSFFFQWRKSCVALPEEISSTRKRWKNVLSFARFKK